eukprot:3810004-Lingulodinium_polyedra.AAC.1
MTRSNRGSANATARKLHARANFLRTHGTRECTDCEPPRQRNIDSNGSLCNGRETLHNDAAKPLFRCRNGSQTARSRAPCADQFLVR